MMNNLFSIFDPSSCYNLSLNWTSMIIIFLMISPSFWMVKAPTMLMMEKMKNSMIEEFAVLLKNNKKNTIVFISLFTLIIMNNVLGLISFSFTATSHLAVTLALALPFWISFILYSMINKMTDFLAHLVPLGTPPVLMPFMVLIEIVSNIIRPITLSVRLAANMIAGHLLLTLLSNQIVTATYFISINVMAAQILLMILETAVACIQAYVFSILITLYASEA